jgi:RNA polymerase sigma factor for flagellar operon FliA
MLGSRTQADTTSVHRRSTIFRSTATMKPNSTPSRKRISTEDALALWREYKATGDIQARNRLVMTYAPLVKYIVFKKVRELPARCEVEDFISCGLEALIASIDRYDPEKGATLEQFAWTRIHGAVLDELRRQDWAPRSLRRWERDIHKAREQFTSLHSRRPTREELAAMLAVSTDELRRRQDDIAVSDVTSLNTLVISDDETNVERIDTLAASDHRLDPEHAATAQAAKDKFRRAFELLPKREREVAVLLYVKNLTLREIGDILGVSESRICQIHSQLKRTLRTQLADDALLFSAVG